MDTKNRLDTVTTGTTANGRPLVKGTPVRPGAEDLYLQGQPALLPEGDTRVAEEQPRQPVLQATPVVLRDEPEAAPQPESKSLLVPPDADLRGTNSPIATLDESAPPASGEAGPPLVASALSRQDLLVIDHYLSDPRLPDDAKPCLERLKDAQMTGDRLTLNLSAPEKRALRDLLVKLHGDIVPDTILKLLKPRLTDPAPLSNLEFVPKVWTPPAAVLEAPVPHRGLKGLLEGAQNKIMTMAGKGKAELTYRQVLDEVNALEPQMQTLSDAALEHKTIEFRETLERRLQETAGSRHSENDRRNAILYDMLPEAFAVAREVAVRQTHMRPFDCQILGATSMAHNRIAEMGTGEGKSLTAVMPLYLRALAGKGSYLVTVNDALADRDAVNYGPIYRALGMTVGTVLNTIPPDMEAKKAGYGCDITYTTNASLGFDYLRDNMAKHPDDVVQRPPYFALVDEVDEILIDEARTPLILSEPADVGPGEQARLDKLKDVQDLLIPPCSVHGKPEYTRMAKIMKTLEQGEYVDLGPEDTEEHGDFQVDDKKKVAWLTAQGQDKVVEQLGFDPWAGTDYDKMAEAVARLQAAGRPVNILFRGPDEAREFTDRLKANGQKFVESRTPHGHPADVIGICHFELPKAGKVHPPEDNAAELHSSDFNHLEWQDFIQPSLNAKALYVRDKDYLVEETPQFIQKRNALRLQLVYNGLPEWGKQAVQVEARRIADQAVQALAHTGTPPPGLLRMWWNGQDPKPDKVPDPVVEAMVSANAFDLIAQQLPSLTPEQTDALEKAVNAQMTTDPDGEVSIVDEFTGRIMPGRRWSGGLHQAVEAKEGVRIQDEQQTNASITYPDYFHLFPNLAGMSGTAESEKEELEKMYGLGVDVIPPNLVSQREDRPDLVFKTKAEKYKAIVDRVEELWKTGQPVLIGTRSVDVNLELSKLLDERGIPHNLLNAKTVQGNTAAENAILAQAGRIGAVTLATNMAGRGVDIKVDRLNYQQLLNSAMDDLGHAARDVRLQAMEARYAALPSDQRPAVDSQAQAETTRVFRQLQRNAQAASMTPDELAAVRDEAGDPKVLGLDAFRSKVSAILDQRLADMPAEQRDALVGAAPTPELQRECRANVMAKLQNLDPRVSFLEADRGVAVSFAKLKEADKLYATLIAKGVPVAWAEPGTPPETFKPGHVTLVVKGASNRSNELPAGAPAPMPVQDGARHEGAVQAPILVDSEKFQSGGLYVIGTERHESRRVDNQLRGRTARQGELGVTEFFLSLEDDLMKHFGGPKMIEMFNKLGVQHGESVSADMISNSITKAQKSVEAMHFDQRANTTKFANVLNTQVQAVYKHRSEVLSGKEALGTLEQWTSDLMDEVLDPFKSPHHHDDSISEDDAQAMVEQVEVHFGVKIEADASLGYKAMSERAEKAIWAAFDARAEALGEDGLRNLVLRALDTNWHTHLDNMSNLQQGIGHEASAQKDPLLMYKLRGGDEWNKFEAMVKEDGMDAMFKPDLMEQQAA